MNLNGNVNGQLLPPSIAYLDLYDNNIKTIGNISDISSNLTYMNLGSNSLAVMATIPSGVTVLILNLNQIKIFPNFTIVVSQLDISDNDLNGPIPTLPPQLTYLSLNSNSMSSGIPNLPTNLTYLDLNNNGIYW